MPLGPGTRLGPYEIQSALGAGGMGEVYKAKDTRLDRIVAVKVLPSHVSDDPALRERFEREARTVAALDHPHICRLYDVGRDDGTDFLVLEYLEGQTLADRLTKGALPLDHALAIGIQIADALAKAHRAGIVHRDLKPGNIMLTKSGAKLLDFGLAKTADPAVAGSLSILPTTPPGLTQQGTILGTFQYMAPEQLEGHEADARTDIFAFGAVLHEMLTGKPAFEGGSQASLIAAIMSSQPAAVSSWQKLAPAALDHVIARCLAKDVENRWQSTHDLKLQLEWILRSDLNTTTPTAIVAGRSRDRLAWVVAVVAVLGLVGISIALVRQRSLEAPPLASQFMVTAPDEARFTSDTVGQSISPDGRQVVFSAIKAGGPPLLWLRSFESGTARPLVGTEQGSSPFWSPDGQSIGFFAQGKLKRIDLASGSPQILADAPLGLGGSWSPKGVIVFAPTVASPLFRVSANGGQSAPVTHFSERTREYVHGSPFFLPDGTHFLFYVSSTESGIYVGSIDSQDVTFIVRSETAATYAAPGYLLFVNGGTLMAQAFDADRLSTRGDPLRVVDRVSRFINSAGFSASNNGVLLVRPSSPSSTELVWVNRAGARLGVVGPPGQYGEIALSPDETQVAFSRAESSPPDVWIQDLRRPIKSRLTSNPAVDNVPVWSPDGRTVAFASEQGGGGLDIYQRPANQSEPDHPLLKLKASPIMFPADWSPDGRYLMYYRTHPQNQNDVWVVPLFGERKPVAVLQSEFNEWQPQFSPDGKWIAYVSDQSGSPQVYVQAFPTQTGTWPISTAGGTQPRWRRDGRELFYLAPDRKLMAVTVKAGPTFEADTPRPLFETTLDVTQFRQTYAVSADGNRFLLNASIDTAAPPLTVVLNWPALLKK